MEQEPRSKETTIFAQPTVTSTERDQALQLLEIVGNRGLGRIPDAAVVSLKTYLPGLLATRASHLSKEERESSLRSFRAYLIREGVHISVVQHLSADQQLTLARQQAAQLATLTVEREDKERLLHELKARILRQGRYAHGFQAAVNCAFSQIRFETLDLSRMKEAIASEFPVPLYIDQDELARYLIALLNGENPEVPQQVIVVTGSSSDSEEETSRYWV